MVESASWLPYVHLGLSGLIIPMVLLGIRQMNRRSDRTREDERDRDKLLRRHQDNITILETKILTKDDLNKVIDQTIIPLDIKIDNNTKVIEDMRGSMKDISDKLQNVSNSLSRQEGYREAKEKSESTGLMTVVPKSS